MNKTFESLLQRLRELNLPEGCFAIFGSGPMGIRDIVDCNDLDVIVTKELYADMKKTCGSYWEVKENEFCEYLEHDGIELYMSWHPGSWDICRLIQESEIMAGLSFVKLSEVVAWKNLFGREKDGVHLKLISDFLSKGKCQFCVYETELIEHIADSIDESKNEEKKKYSIGEVDAKRIIYLCKFCYGVGENHRYGCHFPNMYGEHDPIMKQLSVIGNTILDEIDKDEKERKKKREEEMAPLHKYFGELEKKRKEAELIGNKND